MKKSVRSQTYRWEKRKRQRRKRTGSWQWRKESVVKWVWGQIRALLEKGDELVKSISSCENVHFRLALSSINPIMPFTMTHAALVCWSDGWCQIRSAEPEIIKRKRGEDGLREIRAWQRECLIDLTSNLQIRSVRKRWETLLRSCMNGRRTRVIFLNWSRVLIKFER